VTSDGKLGGTTSSSKGIDLFTSFLGFGSSFTLSGTLLVLTSSFFTTGGVGFFYKMSN
jgi:hypothetical protein